MDRNVLNPELERTDNGWVWKLNTPAGEPIACSTFSYHDREQARAALRGIQQALSRRLYFG